MNRTAKPAANTQAQTISVGLSRFPEKKRARIFAAAAIANGVSPAISAASDKAGTRPNDASNSVR